MKIDAPHTLKLSDHWAESALDKSLTVQNGSTRSCTHRDCACNGTRCIDNPDGPGVIQPSCLREMPSIELCSYCCRFSYLYGICAFCRGVV